MTWLLRLYPRVWRERYGGEVADMLAARPFSLAAAIDLVAGAIDVRLHPSATLAAATAASHGQDKTMLERIMRMECAAMANAGFTTGDQSKASVTVGLTLVLTLIWMAAHFTTGDNAYVDSLSIMPFLVALLFSMRYTYLKNRSAGVQAVFVGGFSLLLAVLMLGIGWITTKI